MVSYADNSDQCQRAFPSQKWILLEAKISNAYVAFFCDRKHVKTLSLNPMLGRTGKGGVLIKNDQFFSQTVFYKNLKIV